MRGVGRVARVVARDTLVLGSLAFLSAKAVTLLFIGANNFVFGRETPLAVVYSNFGHVWRFSDLVAPLLLSPLTETLIFGAVWAIWSRMKVGGVWFLLPSTTLFAAYHLIIPGPHVYRVSIAFVAGLYCAEAFRRNGIRFNGSVGYVASVLVHSLYNALTALV